MKKLMMLVAVCCLVFASCNKQEKEKSAQTPEQQELTEKQKQGMKDREDWVSWENLTDERKAELLNKSKAAYDKQKAAQEEREARKAKFEEAMANWKQPSREDIIKYLAAYMGCARPGNTYVMSADRLKPDNKPPSTA